MDYPQEPPAVIRPVQEKCEEKRDAYGQFWRTHTENCQRHDFKPLFCDLTEDFDTTQKLSPYSTNASLSMSTADFSPSPSPSPDADEFY